LASLEEASRISSTTGAPVRRFNLFRIKRYSILETTVSVVWGKVQGQ